MFFSILFLAHLQAVVIPLFLGIKSINRFKKIKNNYLISLGFCFFGLASFFEMIDHTYSNWIYINHSSFFNWLFYSFLALGLTSLSVAIRQNKLFFTTNILICIFSIISYFLLGKNLMLSTQSILSIILILNWHFFFKDWLLLAYPIFGILFTTFFGMNLYLSNNQIWHIFIGPSGSVSVITFYLILNRYKKIIKGK